MASQATAALASTASGVMNVVQKYNATLRNTLVIAVTVAMEYLVQSTLFMCPCVEESDLKDCNKTFNITKGCKPEPLSVFYGYSILVVPAIALFCTGLAIDIRLWKVYTGVLWRNKNKKKQAKTTTTTKKNKKKTTTQQNQEIKEEKPNRNSLAASIIFSAISSSLLAPTIWVLVALFQGQYYACANTAIPYLFDDKTVTNCSVVYGIVNVSTNANKTFEWKENVIQSHIIGWYFLAVSTVLAFAAFARSRCVTRRGYYETMMATIYKTEEETFLQNLMKGKAERKSQDGAKEEDENNGESADEENGSETKTTTTTKITENVEKFVTGNPSRKSWNDISGVYRHAMGRQEENKEYVMYSYLHRWAKEEEEKAKRQVEEDEGFEKEFGLVDFKELVMMEKEMLTDFLTKLVEPTKKAKLLLKLKENYLIIINTVTIVTTALLESLVNWVVFKCPCVEEVDVKCEAVNDEEAPECKAPTQNVLYGAAYLGVPALVLFFAGMGLSRRLWKYWTGNLKSGKGFFIKVLLQNLVAPIVWICFGLLLGSYYACATTPYVYDIGDENLNKTCMDVNELPFTVKYHRNMALSQAIGWAVISGFSISWFIAHAFNRCNSKLSYYQDKYIRIYRKIEENEFVRVIKEQANKLAKENVASWMAEPRTKEAWDDISNFEEVKCGDEEAPKFSHLHKWLVTNAESTKADKPTKPRDKKPELEATNDGKSVDTDETITVVNEVETPSSNKKKNGETFPLLPLPSSKDDHVHELE